MKDKIVFQNANSDLVMQNVVSVLVGKYYLYRHF